ncbi:MAG: L,D-transpeptidase [Chthoniobacteraceae bacterium]|nr:L,D-transpeptidase [Chthoniobacteraceae bacterium]
MRTKYWLYSTVFASLVAGIGTPRAEAAFWRGQPQAGGPKSVVVDKGRQELRAYEGNRLVLSTRISTGRRGRETPNGRFRAQSKSLMHYSRLYDNAPMPYSVQIAGNYFIHGFFSVPDHPASHGCIRVPLSGSNPARQFYDWVEPGTPVAIVGSWR